MTKVIACYVNGIFTLRSEKSFQKMVNELEVKEPLDLSKPDGKQISMFETKGFIKTTKKRRK
ncbi:hypothetical protein [Flavobacterium soli]|uniref:hypothetical protein n=1 Tax=Flavobacterium soli TaxID=344881 RepID=UPI000478E8F4|nr:hypothetical protein [Flavobacterium soli]